MSFERTRETRRAMAGAVGFAAFIGAIAYGFYELIKYRIKYEERTSHIAVEKYTSNPAREHGGGNLQMVKRGDRFVVSKNLPTEK